MVLRKERHQNRGSTTLDGAINDSVTAVDVTSGSSFPSDGDFRILVDSELMLVTANASNTFTVERGIEGTTAASHSNSAVVTCIETEGGLDQVLLDNYPAILQDAPMGRIQENGVIRTVSDFTWLNQGSASAADLDCGGIQLSLPNEANHQVRGIYRSAPTAPWTMIARLVLGLNFIDQVSRASNYYIGLMGRESSTGKLYILGMQPMNLIFLWRMTNITTFSASVDSDVPYERGQIWFKLEDDNTDVRGHASSDGQTWHEMWNEGRTTHMTGGIDQIGLAGSSGNSSAGVESRFHNLIIEG